MIDHLSTYALDFDATKAFYDAVLPPLGYELQTEMVTTWDAEHPDRRLVAYGPERPVFWIAESYGDAATPRHFAFSAESRDDVDAFWQNGIDAGASDNGEPGPRPHYHEHYYGSFLLDPDGNNVEAVCHRDESEARTVVDHKPEGFHALTPFLHVEDGDAFIDWAKSALGADVRMAHHDDDGRLVHGEIIIEGCVLELSDAREEWPAQPASFHLYVRDPDAAHARAVDEGATSIYDVSDQEYGERSGGVRDPFGNQWYLSRVTDHDVRSG